MTCRESRHSKLNPAIRPDPWRKSQLAFRILERWFTWWGLTHNAKQPTTTQNDDRSKQGICLEDLFTQTAPELSYQRVYRQSSTLKEQCKECQDRFALLCFASPCNQTLTTRRCFDFIDQFVPSHERCHLFNDQ